MLLLDIDHFLAEICQGTPTAALTALMPALGERLACDRVFLYLRSPQTQRGRVPFCWQRHSDIPRIYDPSWKPEPAELTDEDPMFAAAIATQPTIFVEDVETADAAVVNRAFEAKTFGHRALVHAHLCHDGQLWGILQPAVFGQPHCWSMADQALIHAAVERITPLAVEYVRRAALS
jgi:GAF domain